MKNITLALLFIVLTAGITYSQSKPLGTINEIKNIAPDGTQNHSAQPISQELKNLTKEVKKAKNDGDLERIKFYQHKIDVLAGAKEIQTILITDVVHPQDLSTDNFNYTVLNSTHAVSSGAVSTDRVTGTMYTIYSRYIIGACDEIYIYKSTTNGLSWSYFYSFALPSLPNLDYRANEMDLEVVNKGDSAYICAVFAGDNGPGTSGAFFLRIREDGNMFTVRSLWDPSSTTIRLRQPRITSDNARFTTGSYIYLTYTLDSIVGARKFLKSKFAVITNPFDLVLTVSERNNSPGAYSYYTTASQADSAFMQNDICYVNAPGDSDAVVTTTVVRGADAFSGANLYVTTTSNYGSSLASLYLITDSKLLESPRIASPGYLTKNVMIAARRLFAGGDWDPYYYYSTNFNRMAGNFTTTGYIRETADTTLTVNLAARYRSYDNFLYAYADRKSSGRADVIAIQFKVGAFQSFYYANPIGIYGTGSYGAPVAAFRFVNNDSCLVGWGNSSGFGYNITGGVTGIYTDTNNNSISADKFSLNQNYPNPFNPTTKISFTVKQNSFVKLTVYDALGKEAMQLVNEQISAGEHSVEFNALGLSSGVYYYKLEANGFSDVKKMMLIK